MSDLSEGEMKIFPKRCFYSNPGGDAAWDFLEPPKYSQSYNIKIIPYISLEEHEAILDKVRAELEEARDWKRLARIWECEANAWREEYDKLKTISHSPGIGDGKR